MCGTCRHLRIAAIILVGVFSSNVAFPAPRPDTRERVALPLPNKDGAMPLERTLRLRRSVRAFDDRALTLQELSQLLWAAQGVTAPSGYRTTPSAGALYPLSLYVVVGNVASLASGIYTYEPPQHRLQRVRGGDARRDLSVAALGQDWIQHAPVSLVIAATYYRTTTKYGDRGRKYVYMEAGHAAQNIYLQATALDLGTTIIGAFRDERLKSVLGMQEAEYPLCILPVGRPSDRSR